MRTSGRNAHAGLYSRVRGHDRSSPIRSRRSRLPFGPGSRRVSRRRPRPRPRAGRPSRGASTRSSTHPRGVARPWPPSCTRSTASPSTRARRAPERPAGPRPGPLHLPAQGPDLRRRAQPAGPAHRDRPRGPATRREPRQASPSPAAPATPRPRTAARSPDTRPTSSSRPRRACTCSSRARPREILRGVEHVIVDEIHAMAGTKRGAHLALSLERLEAPPTRGRRAAPAHRPVRHAAAAGGHRPLPRRHRAGPRGHDRRCRARASRSSSRSSSRSTT